MTNCAWCKKEVVNTLPNRESWEHSFCSEECETLWYESVDRENAAWEESELDLLKKEKGK